MAGTKKTDNHYTADKIALRIKSINWDKFHEKRIKVLDCFGGRGVLWGAIKKKTGADIDRHAIDKRNDITDFHFHGDNVKVMMGIDLAEYDIIDIDAYGIPAEQLSLVFKSGFKGDCFVTAIQTMNGAIPNVISRDLNFPDEINKKAPSLLSRRGWQYFKEWLALNGVSEITHRSKDRKHYLHFRI